MHSLAAAEVVAATAAVVAAVEVVEVVATQVAAAAEVAECVPLLAAAVAAECVPLLAAVAVAECELLLAAVAVECELLREVVRECMPPQVVVVRPLDFVPRPMEPDSHAQTPFDHPRSVSRVLADNFVPVTRE